MNRVPIRLRLTAAFALAMAGVFAVASLLLVDHLAASLDRTLNESLRSRAADVAALVRQADTGLRQAPAPVGGGGFAQVLTSAGGIFDQTRGLPPAPVLSPRTRRHARSASVFVPRSRVDGADVRLLAMPVHAQDRQLIVVVGASLAARDEALASLHRELVIGGPLALLLTSLVGYLLAGAALRPVERMRVRAGSISERRLAERLPVPTARDEIARLGTTLNGMLARIEQGIERERTFVADASHELRSPLALVRAEVELALEGDRSGEELRAALQSIGEESDRLTQLAEDMLLLARLDEGRVPLREEELDLAVLLIDVATRFERRAEAAMRPIRVDADDQMIVTVDRLRLEQALANLVENALRHGDGTITLAGRRLETAVEISVRDEGRGFPGAFVARAFDRFTRADPARTAGGAGLGLSIVKAVVEAHGGTVAIAAGGAPGAEVRLRLPLPSFADGGSRGPYSRSAMSPAARA
jgi:heavy metal sensor kinase